MVMAFLANVDTNGAASSIYALSTTFGISSIVDLRCAPSDCIAPRHLLVSRTVMLDRAAVLVLARSGPLPFLLPCYHSGLGILHGCSYGWLHTILEQMSEPLDLLSVQ